MKKTYRTFYVDEPDDNPIDTWANDDRSTDYEQKSDDADTLEGSAEPLGPLDASFALSAYDTDSEETARLCCSECGERIELLASGTPFKVFRGGVCGCAEPPKKWVAEQLHKTSDRA